MGKSKRVFLIFSILMLTAFALWWLMAGPSEDKGILCTTVKKGRFIAKVYSTGQLQTEKSESILLPEEMSSRNIDIYEIKIMNIVEEGTVVDSGAYVATLDYAAVEELKTKAQEEYETALNAYEDARIDTNLNLSTLRDELLNARVDLEEKKIVMDQSVYESPAVKRQAKLDVERTGRDLEQQQQNYRLKQKQDELKVLRAVEKVKRQQQKIKDIEQLYQALEVKAPKRGMVIHSYDRMGKKIKAGSNIGRWQPQIAELPDFSSMISKTYINEIDISKVKTGQEVEVGIDAFPQKHFTGRVMSVANMGQVIPNGEAKVFEVVIRINGTDKDLRPAMTTSNIITTANWDNMLFIPLESVFTNDSLSFVFKAEGNRFQKKVVRLGLKNENFVVVERGLNEGDRVSMNMPGNSDDLPFINFASDPVKGGTASDTTSINAWPAYEE